MDSKLSDPCRARVTQLSAQPRVSVPLLQDRGDNEQVGSDRVHLIGASKHSPLGELAKGQLGTQRRAFRPS